MEIIVTIFLLVILIFSIILHELSHGYVAYSLGDPTAKYAGRLTLNPIPHIDLLGSIILPGFLILMSAISQSSGIIFGWAKPVPVNPYNFRDQKWGALKVAAAGPASNFALAIFFGLLIRFIPHQFFLALPGLFLIFSLIVKVNLVLGVFNLLPIPPLDGHWILFTFLSDRWNNLKFFLQQYGFFVLIFLIFFGGLYWMFFIIGFLFYLITGFPF